MLSVLLNKKTFLSVFFLLLSGLSIQALPKEHSLLSEGKWVKLAVSNKGIHKITYDDIIKKYQLTDATGIPSGQIAMFGYGAGMLSATNLADAFDDLYEISILVEDGGDGTFGPQDYILFYGENPTTWQYNQTTQSFIHETNIYSDYTYYFLSVNITTGTRKRIENTSEPNLPSTIEISEFTDYIGHETDINHISRSGKTWYGEKFDYLNNACQIPIYFQDYVSGSTVKLKMKVATENAASFSIKNGNMNESIHIKRARSGLDYRYGFDTIANFSFPLQSPNARFEIKCTPSLTSNKAFLDYMEFNYRRSLRLSTGIDQLAFRSIDATAVGNMTKFNISQAQPQTKVWDITDARNPKLMTGSLSNNIYSFKVTTDQMREFIAFNGHTYYAPTSFSTVNNQDIHGLGLVDYVIVAHPIFFEEAQRLAAFHRQRNKLTVAVVTPEQVYNEFSSGSQDPIAIRRMMKMFYDRAMETTSELTPKYLLLFGNASFDYKNRIANNTNFVPTFQTEDCLLESSSLASDDFFGFLGNGETGLGYNERLKIGIGRFPVSTVEQAKNAVDKSIAYGAQRNLVTDSRSKIISNFGPWRNQISLIADDGEGFDYNEGGGLFYEKTGYFADYINNNVPNINVHKIYLDAYHQQTSPNGARYPEAKAAINQDMEKGTLILNYEGHSGPTDWSDEKVVTLESINKWSNIYNPTVIFSASCSFMHYDDPAFISGGVQAFLNPQGGAIAVVASARIAYTNPNDIFHHNFLKRALIKYKGKAPTFGEIFMLAKNDVGNSFALKPFILVGDPALKIALPEYHVQTTSINGISVNDDFDTIKALSDVSITGEITDNQNQVIEDFNGTLFVTIYDKPSKTKTLGNKNSTHDYFNPIFEFETQNNIIFNGKIPVTQGRFSLDFKAPKDIAYNFGYGKISYYAHNDSIDAAGAFDNIVIGGFSKDMAIQSTPPSINMYLNDEYFISGNISDENPILYAEISDEYGINTSGNGIGHDIIAILDDQDKKPYILNDYFEYALGSSREGFLTFPFYNLPEGEHKLYLKVWNILNESSEAIIYFTVKNGNKATIGHLTNYPNPAKTYTNFYYTHNQAEEISSIEIDIFNTLGAQVANLKKDIDNYGYATEPLYWDCHNLAQGIYIYRLTVFCKDGSKAIKSNKLILH